MPPDKVRFFVAQAHSLYTSSDTEICEIFYNVIF